MHGCLECRTTLAASSAVRNDRISESKTNSQPAEVCPRAVATSRTSATKKKTLTETKKNLVKKNRRCPVDTGDGFDRKEGSGIKAKGHRRERRKRYNDLSATASAGAAKRGNVTLGAKSEGKQWVVQSQENTTKLKDTKCYCS